MAVRIETDAGFVAGRQQVLFEGVYDHTFPLPGYDISIDGDRFLMAKLEPFPDTPITHLHVVLNWFEN